MASHIQTVIFDLGRTLIHFSHDPLEPALAGLSPLGRSQAEQFMLQAEAGRIGAGELRAGLCRLSGLEESGYAAWWNSIFAPGWLVPPEWIRSLKPRFRLGLLSNTNPDHYAFLLEQRPLLREFDFAVLSYAVGAAKPDAKIYAAAEAVADCAPGSIFYADDVAGFVAAARGRGWQARQFTGFETLQSELEAAARPPELASDWPPAPVLRLHG